MRWLCLLSALFSSVAPNVAQTAPQEPIVFVHGNGDDAAKWVPIIWLFESNGYAKDRLYAIRFISPAARANDFQPEENRSSSIDQASQLSAFVARVLLETKAKKVALIGSSRGGITIRNYLKNAGGAAVVSHAILCGTPNHGVFAVPQNLGNEFNGSGPLLKGLNEGDETIERVKLMTLRSDRFDKYAQPDGRPAGIQLEKTGVAFDGPALKGAENVVMEGMDHRELAFQPKAFAAMYRFLTGNQPQTLTVTQEQSPSISGLITGFTSGAPTNQGLPGVHLKIYALAKNTATRDGSAVYDNVTNESGTWGPIAIRPEVEYEFEMRMGGDAVTVFRAPIARSTSLMNFRFQTAIQRKVKAGQLVVVSRPQGYFSKGRDQVLIDNKDAADIAPGLPVSDFFVLPVSAAQRDGVCMQLREERVCARPADADAHAVSIAEFEW